ncbi:pyrethroid hydrolase Ces2e-like [Cylas formicarius]|uniref:pyrethroid hydrolase Ces2e-like n=1 Tax=Cylas formicarius TaxID=197179 RepID=UPI0029588E16|nr:pyrethroid hydrolase Ces2e-like [Cylas formicarius]
MLRQVVCVYLLSIASAADLLIDLPDGTIRGSETITENYTYNAYRGIPYAKPPVGTLRFQAPVPNDPWDGVLDASALKDCCIPLGIALEPQSEDCLYINVFTPSQTTTEKLPVMLWIYGGGFTTGCAQEDVFGPQSLTNEGVIVVTFNYRMGLFGFLSTNDSVILGNAGLKDQLLAMQWTQKNIEYFGGDPEKVTIFGESAGGVSVGAHVANKKSAGLYRAAICQSGCSLTILPSAIQSDPRKNALDIAKSLNPFLSDSSTSEEIRDFLQGVPTILLTVALNLNPQTGIVIEVENENAYVTDHSFTLLESGNFNQVPLIIGTNSAESLSILGILLPELMGAALGYDVNSTLLIPVNLNPVPVSNLNDVATQIKQAYSGFLPFALNLAAFVEFTSDQLFVRSSLKQAEFQSKYSPVYFYQFSYSGTVGSLHIMVDGAGKVGHGEDVRYLFDRTDFPLSTEGELLTKSRMTRLWANFAKTLNPTPEASDPLLNVTWPKASGSDIPYLDIDETLEVKPAKKVKEMEMWNNVFNTYGQQPFVGF